MVAGISGYAVAGGLELALLCDLRVVEDTAIMGLYGRRFGKFCHLKNLIFNIICQIRQLLSYFWSDFPFILLKHFFSSL